MRQARQWQNLVKIDEGFSLMPDRQMNNGKRDCYNFLRQLNY
jgi:hypothetical protein